MGPGSEDISSQSKSENSYRHAEVLNIFIALAIFFFVALLVLSLVCHFVRKKSKKDKEQRMALYVE